MKIKLLVIFILLIGFGAFFIHKNITLEYPTEQICEKIREFNSKHERLPTLEEFNSMKIPEIGVFSIRRYKLIDNDFIFYFGSTFLGPYEVCSLKEEAHFEEI